MIRKYRMSALIAAAGVILASAAVAQHPDRKQMFPGNIRQECDFR